MNINICHSTVIDGTRCIADMLLSIKGKRECCNAQKCLYVFICHLYLDFGFVKLTEEGPRMHISLFLFIREKVCSQMHVGPNTDRDCLPSKVLQIAII